MSNDHVVLNVHIEAVPGREQDLERQLTALIEPTRAEPGCVSYSLHRDPEHPGKFMFYERFQDSSAVEAHVKSDHFQRFVDYRAKQDPVAVMNVTKWQPIK